MRTVDLRIGKEVVQFGQAAGQLFRGVEDRLVGDGHAGQPANDRAGNACNAALHRQHLVHPPARRFGKLSSISA